MVDGAKDPDKVVLDAKYDKNIHQLMFHQQNTQK